MDKKKGFDVYYLLVVEGTTEFNLFAYLTTNKFKILFEQSKIKFSPKIEIVEAGISQGKLDGIGNVKAFQLKYKLIKRYYKGQKRFFILDSDLDDSSKIGALVKQGKDIVQFIRYNSEYLLLEFAGMSPKEPSDFKNMSEFRDYCKLYFLKQFKKVASDLKDNDFDLIFSNVDDKKIRDSFTELFSTLS